MYRIQSIGASGIPKPCQITPGASSIGTTSLEAGAAARDGSITTTEHRLEACAPSGVLLRCFPEEVA
jgi:hypothetical protein